MRFDSEVDVHRQRHWKLGPVQKFMVKFGLYGQNIYIHDNENDHTCHPCTSRTAMNAAWVQDVIWGHQTNKIGGGGTPQWLCENGCLWMLRDQSLLQ
jgi:hypothetical protein